MNLIPTVYKAKISKQLSYPLGAELLSSLLKNTKYYDNFVLYFSDDPYYFEKKKFLNIVKEKKPYPILEINYSFIYPGLTSSNNWIEEGFYNKEHWDINIYPVARNVRHKVQKLIVDSAITGMIEWLNQEYDKTWFETRHFYKFIYDPGTELIYSLSK
jgi:hypothetical protein